ncbi:hypothetical protein O181_009457 [Austropuccinia psidii MF-1]|uniref:Uncharacterized protein n=1 Tax=Austropuccinia psidii MF-1 TaxID=1389203 RepID=A0A9Q3BRT4_9BASI|nr:hypothetical protein [Austropuccinia psidii MF-1]
MAELYSVDDSLLEAESTVIVLDDDIIDNLTCRSSSTHLYIIPLTSTSPNQKNSLSLLSPFHCIRYDSTDTTNRNKIQYHRLTTSDTQIQLSV